MEKLHHPLWIVEFVNALLGPLVAAAARPFGIQFPAGQDVIPDYLVMSLLIVLAVTLGCLLIRNRLKVENPGRTQIVLEDGVSAIFGMLDEWIGPKGRRYMPIVGTMGVFILAANYMGLIPGFMSPTSSINVTLGCTLTVWVYYHMQGVKEQGLWPYLKHFAAPPGAPLAIAPIMLPIELISHCSRIMSLSIRLFGNIFGEELVILILFSIVPFIVPLPMMLLALITGGLQAFIFVLLTVIYLQGAVQVHDEEHDAHGHEVEAVGAV